MAEDRTVFPRRINIKGVGIHHRVADLSEEHRLHIDQRPLLFRTRFLIGIIGENGGLFETREPFMQRLSQRAFGMVERTGYQVFRRERNAERMGTSDEETEFADGRISLCRCPQGGTGWRLINNPLQVCAALLGKDIGHQPARVVTRPVVAEDEPRFHAIGFQLLEEDGVIPGVNAHPNTDVSGLDAVFHRCFPTRKHGF